MPPLAAMVSLSNVAVAVLERRKLVYRWSLTPCWSRRSITSWPVAVPTRRLSRKSSGFRPSQQPSIVSPAVWAAPKKPDALDVHVDIAKSLRTLIGLFREFVRDGAGAASDLEEGGDDVFGGGVEPASPLVGRLRTASRGKGDGGAAICATARSRVAARRGGVAKPVATKRVANWAPRLWEESEDEDEEMEVAGGAADGTDDNEDWAGFDD